jgi:hypothetical protein
MDIYFTLLIMFDDENLDYNNNNNNNDTNYFNLNTITDNIIKSQSEQWKRSNGIEKLLTDGICIHCELCTSKVNQLNNLEKKLKNKYASVSNLFHYNSFLMEDIDKDTIKLDDKFIDNYKNITDIKFQNVKLIFEKDEKFFQKFQKLTSIQLDNCGLDSIPNSILNVKTLKSLTIINNNKIDISQTSNQFEDLNNLKFLILNNLTTTTTTTTTELISLPATIKTLEIKGLKLNYLPFNFNNCLQSIEKLTLSGVEWVTIDATVNKSFMKNREALISLFKHILTRNEINKLFDYFDADKSGFLSVDELFKLNAFIFKQFPRLGDNFNDLEDNNKYFKSYLKIFELKNLRLLDLSYQAVQFIPDQIEGLINLEILNLENCILLEKLSSKVAYLRKLVELNLNDCISLKTPPTEICRRGFSAIKSYLKRLSSGSVKCNRTKL